jgi:dTDP-glucose pyrophosphorylase
MDASRHLIPQSATIFEAMRAIDNAGIQIVFMVGEELTLVGSLTDGDLRRAILSGSSLEDPAIPFVNKNCFFLTTEATNERKQQCMAMFALKAIPIISENRQVTDVAVNPKMFPDDHSDVIVLILAGGRGQRLRPLTDRIPKPLIEVNGVPILGSILAKLRQEGFSKVFLAVNYLHEQIMDYVKDGTEFGLSVEYLIETEFLGTAGSLISLARKLPNAQILVSNADILLESDLGEMISFHQNTGNGVTIGVSERYLRVPFGVVDAQNGILQSIEEKPEKSFLIYSGVGVFRSDLLHDLPVNTYLDLPNLLIQLMSSGVTISTHKLNGFWLDIGTPESFKELKNRFEV